MFKDTKLLIAGIDPGETKGYALIDLEGHLITLGSSKKLTLESLTREISSYGKIILVGTDVNPCPKFVKKIASSLSSDLYIPEHNLLVKKKKSVNNNYQNENKLKGKIKMENKHQKDALAIAVLALKSLNPLFNKINNHLNQNHLTHLSEKVREQVLINKISIHEALSLTQNFS